MMSDATERETGRLIVKICGITSVEDGLAALEAGADWLGLIRWAKSPRYRSPVDAAHMAAQLRAEAGRPFELVGVYVDAPIETINNEIVALGLDRVQLHGDELAKLAESIDAPVLKVIKIKDADSIRCADEFEGLDLLTDTDDPALPGGTGRGYDYGLLRELVERRRVIVAGGLNADNVGDVARGLRPWGVDVSSGVEVEPGVKDHEKVRAFIHAARGEETV